MDPLRERLPARVILAFPAIVGLLLLLPALGAGFVHDDRIQILANPLLRDLSHLPEIWTTGVWAGAGSGSSWYRPLMMASFATDHALFGFSAPAMHGIQLLLFAGVVWLATVFMARVSEDAWLAALAGLLFAVHPLSVEPAVWISARCELLAVGGGLAALLFHDRSLDPTNRKHALRFQIASALCFALALFGKENAVGFLAAFLALDVFRNVSLSPAALVQRHAGFATAFVAYLALRAHALGSVSGGLGGGLDLGVLLAAVGQAGLRMVWPQGLTISPPAPSPDAVVLGGALAGVAAVGGLLALRRRSVLLLPIVLGGGQLAIAAVATARVGELADRYLLLPCLCLAWILVWGLLRLPGSLRRGVPIAVVAASLALGITARNHATAFVDDAALWSDAWVKNPASLRAALNLAALHLDRGEPLAAEAWLDRAAALAPEDRQVVLNRAVAAEQLGRKPEARRLLLGLAERDARDGPVQLALAHLALDSRDFSAAANHYRAALAALPGSAEAWAGLGVAERARGNSDAAREALARALALDPQAPHAEALRQMLEALGPAPTSDSTADPTTRDGASGAREGASRVD